MTIIRVNGKEIELTSCCRWSVHSLRDYEVGYGGKACTGLYNINIDRFEGVEGDIVKYYHDGVFCKGHVVGYTCGQFIETKEWGKVILSRDEYRGMSVAFIHMTDVELVKR